jgi:hypothetical protein
LSRRIFAQSHDFFLGRNSNSFVLFIFFELRRLLFIGLLCLDRGILVGVTEQVLRFAIKVQLRLDFETTIALLATKEIVVLTATTDPTAIRKIELTLRGIFVNSF